MKNVKERTIMGENGTNSTQSDETVKLMVHGDTEGLLVSSQHDVATAMRRKDTLPVTTGIR
jgi:hypothetical protein